MKEKIVTSGFISVVGRTNAGKSTLLNNLVKSPIALVSKKVNATRKRMDIIIPFENEQYNSQLIFIDTPGLHESKKLLNEYMLQEANKAVGDSDLSVFVAVASTKENEILHYRNFLEQHDKRHIVLLNKIDTLSKQELLECLESYKQYQDQNLGIIPVKAKDIDTYTMHTILSLLVKNLPLHPHFYDNDMISTTIMRDIYKEAIREAVFERFSDEIPYESDVKILKVTEKPRILYIKAQIIVAKDSQKAMIIGRNGETIKSLGSIARKKCEYLAEQKVFLELIVKTIKGWNTNKETLKEIGYDFMD
ncbi:GTPase Era [Helicobacter trogontum]|uniref:GTPase Era n=1 Tax=Helicobacter trogontum TaxID=50960 RepID=A0A4U8T7C3_9HELI|nr:GTPase Era [Helicobacter trogontum]MDY5185844.1 GTPase Era [Helicobacter trogontum]TLD95501.1 GTPase Era [Helicobacter trogontum]